MSGAPELIVHYDLPGLLPAEQVLTFSPDLGTLALLTVKPGRVSMLVERQFSTCERSVLQPLSESWPHYCPNEILLASFRQSGNWQGNGISEAAVAGCRTLLAQALRAGGGSFAAQMRPVRQALSSVRRKLWAFGLEIDVETHLGYALRWIACREGSQKDAQPCALQGWCGEELGVHHC